tara:strand:+ start:463 stop:690 length:228 start_codon:yes stop_codon:yes gene_type:complete
MTLEVQTIRVSKTIPKKQADLMVKKMGFKLNVKPNPQYKNFHSYRQIQPSRFIRNSFRAKKINKDMFMIVGKLKN